jgi:type II secretory pathway component PulF
MTSFAFRARSRDGKTVKGVRVAVSEMELARSLALESMFLLRCEPAQAGAGAFGLRGPKVKRKELISFMVHLGSYLEAGVPLLTALGDYRLPEQPEVDAAIQDIRRRIEAGSSMAEAMEAYPTLFSPMHVSMVRAGESTGRMDEVLQEVVKLVEWEDEFNGQVKQAATYPVIVVCILALVVVLVGTFALPAIIKLLNELHVPLPLPTRILMALGGVMASWGWLMALLAAAGFVGFKAALRGPRFRLWWDTRKLGLPLVGGLITRIGLSRFATFFSAQYHAGIPILQVLRQCQGVTGNARLALCVRRIREGVEGGERLGAMAAAVGYFPTLVVRMLAIGEEAGNLERTLGKVSQYFDAEVRADIKKFFQALEPLLMVTLAAVIVFIAVSILLPIYTMIGSINAQAH